MVGVGVGVVVAVGVGVGVAVHMTPAERDELRRLAKAATPGPWHAFQNGLGMGGSTPVDCETGVEVTFHAPNLQPIDYANLAYCAAANPSTILALLDALDRAEAVVAVARVAFNAYTDGLSVAYSLDALGDALEAHDAPAKETT